MFTYQAIGLIIFLVPGFLSMAFFDMLTPAVRRDSLQRVVMALVLSLVIYSLYSLVFRKAPFEIISQESYDLQMVLWFFQGGKVLLILVMSLMVAIIMSFFVKYDWHMKFFRWIKITDKTSRNNIWFDVFTDIKSYLIVNYKDGTRLCGWPLYYADDIKEKGLFLSDVKWVHGEQEVLLNSFGVLIVDFNAVSTIEFLKTKSADEVSRKSGDTYEAAKTVCGREASVEAERLNVTGAD
ncbi:DUF6338 family protein [Desulfovibrio sp. JY]|nr:DUF6338 family protein [Desulfovibrio sp. JY]